MNAGQNLIAAFSEEHVARLTGVTRNQLRHWDRIRFFTPTFADNGWRDLGRIYSFRDVVALRVLGTLRNQYHVSLGHLREVKERLAEKGIEAWTGVKLYVLSRKVFWIDPGSKAPEEVLSGQRLPMIELDAVLLDAKAQAQNLTRRDPSKVGKIERTKQVNQSSVVLAGTRIPVRAIKRFHDAGYSAEQIINEYPDLTEEDVAAALAYQLAA